MVCKFDVEGAEVVDLTFSCITNPDGQRMDAFQSETGAHVRTQQFDWGNAWDE